MEICRGTFLKWSLTLTVIPPGSTHRATFDMSVFEEHRLPDDGLTVVYETRS